MSLIYEFVVQLPLHSRFESEHLCKYDIFLTSDPKEDDMKRTTSHTPLKGKGVFTFNLFAR